MKPRRRRALVGFLVVGLVLVILLAIGFLPRRTAARRLRERAQETALADSVPAVHVVRVERAPSSADLTLPGAVQGMHETAIFARASGYVRRWYADIGTPVRAGQLLADIEDPDIDQQLMQARATLAQNEAALRLAKADLDRWTVLARDSVVTREELDQRRATYEADRASVAAAEANVRRLEALVRFRQVVAPFSGVVTARNVDVGALVTAGAGVASPTGTAAAGATSTASSGLFQMARTDTVRIYIGVPQTYAPLIHPGIAADVRVAERPGQTFRGRVVRTATALDPASLTLLTEVDIPNSARELLAGMYAEAHLRLERKPAPVVLPAGAFIVRTGGPQTAVVGPDSTVHLRSISVVRDNGATLEISTGLTPGETVVLNPPDNLRDGQRVRPRAGPGGG